MHLEIVKICRNFRRAVGIALAGVVILTGCNLEPDLGSIGQGSTSGAGGADRRAEAVSFQDIVNIDGLELTPGDDYVLTEIDGGNGYELVINGELSTFGNGDIESIPGIVEPGSLPDGTSIYVAVLLGSARSTSPDSLAPDEFDLVGPEGWSYDFTRNARLVWFTSAPGVSDRRFYADIYIPSYTPIIRTAFSGVSVRYADQNDRVFDGQVEVIFEEPVIVDGDEQGSTYAGSSWQISSPVNLDFSPPVTETPLDGTVVETLDPSADGYTAAATAQYGGEFDASSDVQHIRFFGPFDGGPVLPGDDPDGPDAETLFSPAGYTVGLHTAAEVSAVYYIDVLPEAFESYVFGSITASEYQNIPVHLATQEGSDWTVAPDTGNAFDDVSYGRYLGPLQSRGSHYVLIVYSGGYQPRLIEIDVPLYGRDINVFNDAGERITDTSTLSVDQTVFFAASEDDFDPAGPGLEPSTIVLEDADTGVILAQSSTANGLLEYTFTATDRDRTFRAYATYAENRDRTPGEPFLETLSLTIPADAIPVSSRAELALIGNGAPEWPADGYYYLTADIDLSGSSWTPLPEFSGTFDGNGRKIVGLTIETVDENDVGLFSELNNANVLNVSFENASVHVTESDSNDVFALRVGVLAGSAQNVTVADVSVQGGASGRSDVGGLIGRIESNSAEGDAFRLERIQIEATVSGTGNYIGGMIGLVTESQPSTERRAGVFHDIEVRPPTGAEAPHIQWTGEGVLDSLGTGVGGVFGRLRAGSVGGPGVYEVRNVRSYVSVEGSRYVGGIVGQVRSTEIVDAQVGSVGGSLTVAASYGTGASRAGAVAGYSNHLIIRNALLSGDIRVEGGSEIGGFLGRTDGTSLEITSPAINGDLTVTGTIDAGAIVGSVDENATLTPSNLQDPEALGLSEDDIEVLETGVEE